MTPTRFKDVAATTIPDQIGVPQLVIVGLDLLGRVWTKTGDGEWQHTTPDKQLNQEENDGTAGQ